MTLVYIGVFLIAVSFAIVAILIAKTLLNTSKVLATLGDTLGTVEGQLDKSIAEVEAMTLEVNETAVDVEAKLQATEGLFLAIENVGKTTAIISNDLQHRTKQYYHDEKLPGTMPFIRAIQFGEFGFSLFESWKRGQNAKM